MAPRDFKNIPGAAKPGQATDLGKRNQDIDKYLADQIEKPEIADAAKQTANINGLASNPIREDTERTTGVMIIAVAVLEDISVKIIVTP